MDANTKKLYKVVLTGGPCGGKTTGQSRLCSFFENLGWKVYRVPEVANVLLSGGIKFQDLSEDEIYKFQKNILNCILEVENTFFELGQSCTQNCLIICDRGTMDAAAYIQKNKWEQILTEKHLNTVDLRDNRYNQIIHMVSAACGAEEFYTLEDHMSRTENVSLAKSLDDKVSSSWIGHPYYDVIDNSTDFETKIRRMINTVCQKLGIDTDDRLSTESKKHKWLVKGMPNNEAFPPYQDFDVVLNYLQSCKENEQSRLRKRGQEGHWNYTHTIRKTHVLGQVIEVKTQLKRRDYINLLSQKDLTHHSIHSKRRCFIFKNQYFQLDIYCEPRNPKFKDLIILETHSALDREELKARLPQFLDIQDDVTGKRDYSMYNLSLN